MGSLLPGSDIYPYNSNDKKTYIKKTVKLFFILNIKEKHVNSYKKKSQEKVDRVLN